MNCYCSLPCFTFEKLYSNGNNNFIKSKNYRCGYNGDKKNKVCSFFKEEIITEIKGHALKKNLPKLKHHKINYKKDLYHYIDMYENFIDKEKVYYYIENINLILKILGYPRFNSDKENIEKLKERIRLPPPIIKTSIKNKTTNIIELPVYIKNIKRCKRYKRNSNKNTENTIIGEELSEDSDTTNSDENSEDENEIIIEEEVSDVEDYQSDGGYFSD